MGGDAKPRLPAANEFTPKQLGGADALYTLLALVVDKAGDRAAIIESIRLTWFSDSALARTDLRDRLEQQRKRSANVISGMKQYGLLARTAGRVELTDLGRQILAKRNDPDDGYRILAAYLLRERHGLELLQIAHELRKRDGDATKSSVDVELRARGYHVSTNSSYSGKLRQWLAASGVVDDEWIVDESLLADLAGVSSQGISSWRSLTSEQKATIAVLRVRAVGNRTPIRSTELLDLLRQRGVDFDPGQVRKKIYEPLHDGGWIEHEVLRGGRGGKGGLVSLTPKSLELDVDLIEGLELGNIPVELQKHLGRSRQKILDELESGQTAVKGSALELLSLRLASEIGLLPIELRLRSSQTGGAEVDLVAEGAHLHFSRWLFQCKNQTSAVGLPVLAKEIGMATLLKAQVVVVVTTGAFARTVKDYAKQAAQTSAIQIVLLDEVSLANYRSRGARALREELHSIAVDTLSLKREQLSEVPREV